MRVLSLIDIASEAPNPLFRRTTDQVLIAAARARAGLPEAAPIIVYVGGLAPHKNLHGLLDGFERANSRGHAQEVHVALVGDFEGAGFLSNYGSLWRRVEENPELRNRVHFTGYVSDEDLVAPLQLRYRRGNAIVLGGVRTACYRGDGMCYASVIQ